MSSRPQTASPSSTKPARPAPARKPAVRASRVRTPDDAHALLVREMIDILIEQDA